MHDLLDQSSSKKVFMIMAGGTGGHIFPGLAVAEELQEKGYAIHWLGTRQGLESDLVPKNNLPISFLSVQGVRGKGIKALFLAPWRIIRSTLQAIHIMRKVKPIGVLGMGGFVAGPGSLAAKLLGIPLIIHEQNAVEGVTNRLAAPMAKKVLVAFPEAFAKSKKTIFTGNPVRKAILSQQKNNEEGKGVTKPLHLLVLGGSRGALAINEVVPEALYSLGKLVHVWHQTGAGHEEATQALYDKKALDGSNSVNAKVEPFIDEMEKAYQWADLVICRAGALTVAELANAGKAAILVPYPWHKDQQQYKNAEYLVKNKAAILIAQQELMPEKLSATLLEILDNRQLLQQMSKAAKQCAKPEAASTIANICKEIACG